MEAAHLRVPFSTARLYSFLNEFDDKQFKYEMWLCHKYMELRMEDIYNMPVGDRKDFINVHNKIERGRKERMGGK